MISLFLHRQFTYRVQEKTHNPNSKGVIIRYWLLLTVILFSACSNVTRRPVALEQHVDTVDERYAQATDAGTSEPMYISPRLRKIIQREISSYPFQTPNTTKINYIKKIKHTKKFKKIKKIKNHKKKKKLRRVKKIKKYKKLKKTKRLRKTKKIKYKLKKKFKTN